MRIYITTQGAKIVKEGDILKVKKENNTYKTIFFHKVEQVLIFGNISLTAPALHVLLKNNVDTVFLTRNGRYLGRLALPESKNVFLRKKQFLLLEDKDFALRIAKQIVKAKMLSMATLLMRIKRTKKQIICHNKAKEIKDLIQRLDHAATLDSLRGYEGRASSIYFSALKYGFIQDFGFSRRVRRPPTDPVNAVLSLLYTMLFNRVYSAIRSANLDPYPAFLHVPDYGRHALVMDLMEEFRVIIADTLTLSLFNLKILQDKDFEIQNVPKPQSLHTEKSPLSTNQPDVTQDPLGLISDTNSNDLFDTPPQRMTEAGLDTAQDNSGKRPVKLTSQAFKRVIENFERKLTTKFFYEPLQQQITYEDALYAQARQYRKVIEGEAALYEPLLLK